MIHEKCSVHLLKAILTVVREECITKAAEVLHITQSTLSRQLAQMEETLGVQLFIRGTRKIALTNEGMLMHRRYEKLNVIFKSNLPANGCIIVYNRLAYAITVTGSIELWDKEKITYRSRYPELTATSVLAWKRHQPFGRAAEKFIEYLKTSFSEK